MDKEVKLQALITEREGMIAENNECMNTGGYVAYRDEEFYNLADRISELNKVVTVEMSNDEVIWLMGVLQNPLSDDPDPNNEDQRIRKIRERLFNGLNKFR